MALLFSLLITDPALSAGQANVFVYHRFNDSRYPSTNISNEDFRAHLEVLRENNFKVLTLGQVVEGLQGDTELPERCAVITVDDAFRSFLSDGWPLLKTYGYPATLFVSTDSVGGGDYLSWPELRLLQNEGVEIGNHSAAHSYLLDNMNAEGWVEDVREDIARSRRAFQVNMGSMPQLFAYPYGEYSPEVVTIVKEAGFVAAFGQQSGVIERGQDMFSLPRFPMGAGFVTLDGFRSKLFMKPLTLDILSPKSPVIIDENPPVLRFYLKQPAAVASTMNCYVQGQTDCQVVQVEDADGLYEVRAKAPVSGRRSKYTVTASDVSGRTWYWFSQLWVLPHRSPVPDNSVPR